MNGEEKREGNLGEGVGGDERGRGNCDPALKT